MLGKIIEFQLSVEWIPHFPEPPEHVLRLADADLKRSFSHFLFPSFFVFFITSKKIVEKKF